MLLKHVLTCQFNKNFFFFLNNILFRFTVIQFHEFLPNITFICRIHGRSNLTVKYFCKFSKITQRSINSKLRRRMQIFFYLQFKRFLCTRRTPNLKINKRWFYLFFFMLPVERERYY